MSACIKYLTGAIACALVTVAAPVQAGPTPEQARAKLVAALECRDKRSDTFDIPALVKAAGGKRTQHEVGEFGDATTTFKLNAPITVFGHPVSKLLTWQNSGDGGDASFGLNAYYSAPPDAMVKAVRTKRQKVDGNWLNRRKVNDHTSLIVDVRKGETISFCETVISD